MNKYRTLLPSVYNSLKNKFTEPPFSGKYLHKADHGSYLCRGCGAVLFRAEHQIQSNCGWPSFDNEIIGSIKQVKDVDGRRIEILCEQCDGHLGHIFYGENITSSNKRYCVNSLAIEYIEDQKVFETEEAILAGGCFWGVEYLLLQLPGVLLTEVGYTGGLLSHPTYMQVCTRNTGHVEAVRVIYDSKKLSYENLIKYFMEIHDPTQTDGQGPDYGSQYLSRIFYINAQQKAFADRVIQKLTNLGVAVATELELAHTFWPAEEDHQKYYQKNNGVPYCHQRVKRF